ncbi:MAG: hypothetical protein RLZZ218_40 [Actinomycetota bacterium]
MTHLSTTSLTSYLDALESTFDIKEMKSVKRLTKNYQTHEVSRFGSQLIEAMEVVTYAESLKSIARIEKTMRTSLEKTHKKDVLIVAVGAMATVALKVAELLAAHGIGATVVDPRWVVPVRKSVLDLASQHRLVVTIEDGVRVGGIGTRIRQDLRAAQIDTALNELGLPDEFLEHASRNEILDRVGLKAQDIAQEIVAQVLGSRVPHAKQIDEPTKDSRRTI